MTEVDLCVFHNFVVHSLEFDSHLRNWSGLEEGFQVWRQAAIVLVECTASVRQ